MVEGEDLDGKGGDVDLQLAGFGDGLVKITLDEGNVGHFEKGDQELLIR